MRSALFHGLARRCATIRVVAVLRSVRRPTAACTARSLSRPRAGSLRPTASTARRARCAAMAYVAFAARQHHPHVAQVAIVSLGLSRGLDEPVAPAAASRGGGFPRLCVGRRKADVFAGRGRKDHRCLPGQRQPDLPERRTRHVAAGQHQQGKSAPRRGHRTAGSTGIDRCLPAPDGRQSDRFHWG